VAIVRLAIKQTLRLLCGFRFKDEVIDVFVVCSPVVYSEINITLKYYLLAVSTRPPDGVLLGPAALAARRLRRLASLITVVRTEFRNRSLGVASAVVRT